MNRATIGLFAVLVSLAAAAPLPAAETPSPADKERARDLVRQLASEDFAVREDAARRLGELGRKAETVLEEGVNSDDQEVRRRCTDLLALARRSDLEVALADFLVHRDPKVLSKLPAYPRFVKVAGDGAEARGLFVEMCLSDAALMVEANKDPAAAAAALVARCQDYQQKMRFGIQPLPLGEVAVLLYVGADDRVNLELTNLYVLSNMLYHQDVRRGLESNAAARRLLVNFLEHRNEPNFVFQKLNLVQMLNLKEGLPWAVKLAADKNQPAHVRGQALALLARLGGKDNVADVEPLLADTTQVGRLQFNQVQVNTEMRDVALGVLIVLNGQKLEDYEFPYFVQFPQVLANQQRNPNGFYLPYNCLGFADGTARDKAFKKYKDAVGARK